MRTPKTADAEAPELAALLEFSRVLGGNPRLRTSLEAALAVLTGSYGAAGAAAMLFDDTAGDLRLEAATGIPDARRRAVRLKSGEAVTGRVAATGKPIVVPQVSKEPLLKSLREPFPASVAAKRELSLVAVPVTVDQRTVGALSLALPYDAARDFARATSFLGVVASLVGQTLRVQRRVEAERKRLLDENTELKEELRERYELRNLVGNSAPMRRVLRAGRAGGPLRATVLVRGESGTGQGARRPRASTTAPPGRRARS